MHQTTCNQCSQKRFCFDGVCNRCYRENNPAKKNYPNRLSISYEPEEIEEFKKNIKKKCSWCGKKIPGTVEHYMEYGNACKDTVTCKSRKMLQNDGYLSDIRILV